MKFTANTITRENDEYALTICIHKQFGRHVLFMQLAFKNKREKP